MGTEQGVRKEIKMVNANTYVSSARVISQIRLDDMLTCLKSIRVTEQHMNGEHECNCSNCHFTCDPSAL